MNTAMPISDDLDQGYLNDESDKSGISAVSILTIGEAKGHDLYVDNVSLEKALTLMQSAPNGVKVKLNHGSGLENVVGFARNPRITEDKLVADLHLLKSSPHYGLIKEMASEAPDQFGVSLAFYNETEEIEGKQFIRPISVKSADLVGEPAANASLFEALTQFSMNTAKALGIEFAGSCGQEDDGTFGSSNDCAVGHGRPSKGDSDPRDKSRPLPPPTKENTSYKGGIVQQAGPSDPSKNKRLLPATRKQAVKARQAISQEASDASKVNPKSSDPAWTGTKSIQADNIKGIISDFKKQTAAHKYGPTTDRQKAYYKQTASQLKEISKKLYDSSKSSWNNDFNKLAYSANEVADQIDRLSKARSIFEEGYNNLNKLLEFRCWEGYEPVAGKAPYSEGSCKPIEAEKPFDKEKNTMNEDYNKVMEALSALEKRLASLEEGKAPMDEEKDKKDEAMAEAPKIVIEKEDDDKEDVAEMSAVIKKVLTEFGIKPVPASPATEVKKVEAKNFEALVKSHPEYANSKLKAIRAVMLSHPSEYREATQRGITTL
jgi:predicted nuclease with TOPRIM domain